MRGPGRSNRTQDKEALHKVPLLAARLLGETSFSLGGTVLDLPNRKSRTLLAYLCMSETGSESRERIVGLLWSETEPQRARASLRQAIYEVRTRLEGAGFTGFDSDNLTVRLQPDLVECDLLKIFGELDGAAVHPELIRREQATDGLLQDLESIDPSFSTWLHSQREVFRRRAVLGLEKLLAKPGRDVPLAKQAATALLNLDPAHETGARALMHSLVAEGNNGAALEVYKRLWDYLDAEFEIEPSEDTQKLVAEIKLLESSAAGAPGSILTPNTHAALPVSRTAAGDDFCALIAVSGADHAGALWDRLAQQIAERRASGRRIESGEPHVLLVQVETVAEAFRIGQLLRQEPRNLEAVSGIHFAATADVTAKGMAISLAKAADLGQIIASENARECLVEGIDASISDLGMVRFAKGDSARAFSLSPIASEDRGRNVQLRRMQPVVAVVPVLAGGDNAAEEVATILLAEECAHALSQSQLVDVISTLSTRRLVRRALTASEIGRRLAADYVVFGSFTTAGSQKAFKFELVDTKTEITRWQDRRELKSLSTECIKSVADDLSSECFAALLLAQLAQSASAPLAALDSYKLLFSSIALMDRWTRSSFHRAREHLTVLRRRAPLHHWPNAWLSAWHIRSISQGWSSDATADGNAALEYAKVALDSNVSCSLAIAMEGWANVYSTRRLDFAIDRLSQAVELNNSDSLAWLLKGVTHAFIDQPDKAVEAVERALKLSPLDPRRSYYEALAAGAMACTDHFDRTIELAQSSLRANRLHASPLRALATAQWYSGREVEARGSVRRLIELEPGFTVERYRRHHPAADSKYGRRIADALSRAGAP